MYLQEIDNASLFGHMQIQTKWSFTDMSPNGRKTDIILKLNLFLISLLFFKK